MPCNSSQNTASCLSQPPQCPCIACMHMCTHTQQGLGLLTSTVPLYRTHAHVHTHTQQGLGRLTSTVPLYHMHAHVHTHTAGPWRDAHSPLFCPRPPYSSTVAPSPKHICIGFTHIECFQIGLFRFQSFLDC